MEQEKIKILLAEDDPNLAFLLKSNFEAEGYHISCYTDGLESWNAYNDHHFDLCLLDVMLPKLDGFQLAEMIRKKSTTIPILFLTARTLKEDIYNGFEAGADDYITKPFTIRELLLRVKAILKRTNPKYTGQQVQQYNIGEIIFNYASREVVLNGKKQSLSTKENELLRIFCDSKNIVMNRSRLLMEVWGNDDYFVSKSLDVYITRLRKLLSVDPNISIQNYHSVGYKLIEKKD